MQVWEIILPCRDNSGVALHQAHKHFVANVANAYGGITQSECAGVWVGAQGRVYTDASIRYQVAADDKDVRGYLLNAARALFPDQEAFYIAQIGAAEIIKA